jgi:hypothetical protein
MNQINAHQIIRAIIAIIHKNKNNFHKETFSFHFFSTFFSNLFILTRIFSQKDEGTVFEVTLYLESII